MFGRVLNTSLDDLSCFGMVLCGIHGNVNICQSDYNTPSKLEFSLYLEVIDGGATFRLTKG